MQWTFMIRQSTQRFVELKLQKMTYKVSGIWRVASDMIFGTGVKIVFASWHRRLKSLILFSVNILRNKELMLALKKKIQIFLNASFSTTFDCS